MILDAQNFKKLKDAISGDELVQAIYDFFRINPITNLITIEFEERSLIKDFVCNKVGLPMSKLMCERAYTEVLQNILGKKFTVEHICGGMIIKKK